jgi:SAM-dependent methyltransferase
MVEANAEGRVGPALPRLGRDVLSQPAEAPDWVAAVVGFFAAAQPTTGSALGRVGATSDVALGDLRQGLEAIGLEVEAGRRKESPSGEPSGILTHGSGPQSALASFRLLAVPLTSYRLRALSVLFTRRVPGGLKGRAEMVYWTRKAVQQGALAHTHYRTFFTEAFGIEESFYDGKRLLDVGCGPRGSLEWADSASERVGLDPLADLYLKLGAEAHRMRYVAAPAEAMPFADGSFDVVSSFNSLDHVDDLDRTVAEIVRVLAPGGVFLLLTDVGHKPTIAEPRAFGWEVVKLFQPALRVDMEQHLEKADSHAVYRSAREGVPYDHSDPKVRYGLLVARLVKDPIDPAS